MPFRKDTDFIVIHCSATKPSMDIGVKEIRKWHIEERGFLDIAYAEVIRRDGVSELGRDLDPNIPAANEVGAAVFGYNHKSVSVCLVGGIDAEGNPEDNFTPEQMKRLAQSLRFYKTLFPDALIVGHNQLDSNKDCPCFDVAAFLKAENLQ